MKIESLDAVSGTAGQTKGAVTGRDSVAPNVVMKKERNYQGMFEYRREDEQIIIRNLIIGKFT